MITVVYACNDAYVRQTLVSMVSVLENNKNVKFYLVSEHISEENSKLITDTLKNYGHTVNIIELTQLLQNIDIDESGRHPSTIYAKLFLDKVIEEDRVLYLDSDVVVAGSLEPLFMMQMDGKAAAGVLMPYSSKIKLRTNCESGKPYICDGVVLLNLNYWREKNKSKLCVDYIRDNNGNPPMLSEGTLNHICQNEMVILDPQYNVMPSMLMYNLKQLYTLFRADFYYNDPAKLQRAKENPIVIHFMNELYNRPWFTSCDHPLKKYYLEMEWFVFGNNKVENQSLNKHTRITRWLLKWMPFPVFAFLYHQKNGI